jgi:3-oxoacyl-[acyl-carrier-protein] synthase-1
VTGQPLTIVGSGMVTAVGLDAPSACAAIRCGINNFRETAFIDSTGEPIVGSEVPLEEPWRGPNKLARMLAAVIEQSFETDATIAAAETPVIICIPERERPGRYEHLKQRLADEVASRGPLHPDSMIVSQGRVGGVVALREARALLYGRGHSAVVIAGVDSYLSGPTLAAYEAKRRLLTPANSNGFIPGEGAAAVIVKRPTASAEPQVVVRGIGFALEQATIEGEQPLRADGLVEAIRGALADASMPMQECDFRITDVSGEQYAFKEAALALARLLRARKEEFDLWHPADCIGEVGAAAGPAVFNVAWAASRKGYAKGMNILCHFGNDDGKRAAVVLTYRHGGGGHVQ